MRLPDAYESLTGAALAAAVGLLRRRPSGVDAREVEPARIEVAIVPLLRGACPRVFGPALEQVAVVVDTDPEEAGRRALAAVKVAARDARVRDGGAAVVARRIGGQS